MNFFFLLLVFFTFGWYINFCGNNSSSWVPFCFVLFFSSGWIPLLLLVLLLERRKKIKKMLEKVLSSNRFFLFYLWAVRNLLPPNPYTLSLFSSSQATPSHSPGRDFIYCRPVLSAAVMHLFIYVGVKWRFRFPFSSPSFFLSFWVHFVRFHQRPYSSRLPPRSPGCSSSCWNTIRRAARILTELTLITSVCHYSGSLRLCFHFPSSHRNQSARYVSTGWAGAWTERIQSRRIPIPKFLDGSIQSED